MEAKRLAAQTDEPETVARVPVAGVFDATAPEPFDPEPVVGRYDVDFWVVVDPEAGPVYAAAWAGACHDHINEALAEGIAHASDWVVRAARYKEQP